MRMMLKNLTPHEINFYDRQPEDGGVCFATLPKPNPEDVVRVVAKTVDDGAVDLVIGGVDVTVAKWQNPDAKLGENFPAPEEGVLYLVSRPAAAAAWKEGRTDVCCPGVAVRNAEGQQIGCIGVAFS